MSDQVWYEVDALTADLTSRRYRVLATSEEGAERKMRDRCPAAVAILVLEDRAALRPAMRPNTAPDMRPVPSG